MTTPGAGLAPLFDRNLYKRPAPGSGSVLNGGGNLPSFGNKETASQAPQIANNPTPLRTNNHNFNNGNEDVAPPVGQRTPNRPLRRPYRRRRPQVDYYYYDDEYEDEFYDERGRRRQQRPRNRRPIYDDYDNRRPYEFRFYQPQR